MRKGRIKGMMGLLLAICAVAVLADTQSTTVTFVIPGDISHTLSYGNANSNTCSSSLFYFVEDDGSIDGNQEGINVSDSSAGGSSNYCQNGSIDAITITNTGNDLINVTANFTSSLPTGIVVVVADNFTNYQSTCGGTSLPATDDCVNVSNSAVIISADLAVSGTKETWWWADFASADVGAGAGNAGSAARTMQTNATDATS